MGDSRFLHSYQGLVEATDRLQAIQGMTDDEAVGALAAAGLRHDPYVANVLATEVMNRLARKTTILATASEGLIATDAAGRTTYVNPAAEAMLGWPRGDIAGLLLHDALAMADRHGVPLSHAECPIHAALTHGQVMHVEGDQLTRRDGPRFPAEYTAAPIWRDGVVDGAVIVFRDITARMAQEAALRESHRLLQGTLDGLSAQIAILDAEGGILAVNAAWKRFAAQNAAPGCGAVGMSYLNVCESAAGPCSEGAAEAAEGIRGVLDGRRESFTLEYPCHSPTERRWFILRVTRFPGEGPAACVVAHENITARKLAEDALRASLRECAGEAPS